MTTRAPCTRKKRVPAVDTNAARVHQSAHDIFGPWIIDRVISVRDAMDRSTGSSSDRRWVIGRSVAFISPAPRCADADSSAITYFTWTAGAVQATCLTVKSVMNWAHEVDWHHGPAKGTVPVSNSSSEKIAQLEPQAHWKCLGQMNSLAPRLFASVVQFLNVFFFEYYCK
jgi:hypothetical protein